MTSAVLVFAQVGERREKARQKVPVCAVEFEPVGSGPCRKLGGTDKLSLHSLHIRKVHRLRYLAVLQIGQGGGRDQRPVPRFEWPVDPLPRDLGRPFSSGMVDLDAKLRRRIGANEFNHPGLGRGLPLVPQSKATRRDPRIGRHTRHLTEDQARTAERARAEMD